MPFEEAVADFPADAINRRGSNFPFSPWQLLEHIRLTQWDIVDYIQNREYVEPHWPAAYWPPRDQQATAEQFAEAIARFRSDNETLRTLLADASTDLFAVIPGTPGHTILREIRIVGDHNAYHVGEFGVLRHVMGTWPPERRE